MPSDRQKLFLEGPIGRVLVRLAIPIILGNLLQTGYQLTDAFWVGRLGAAAVAAVSISFPVTFLVIALGAGLGIAGATLSAQYMGAGRQDLVNHVAAQTMLMVTVTSAVLGAAGYAVAPLLLDLLGVAPDVHAGALGFMRVSFVGILFIFVYAMFQHTKTATRYRPPSAVCCSRSSRGIQLHIVEQILVLNGVSSY
jgi:Na+-driven multidrug efflux pump